MFCPSDIDQLCLHDSVLLNSTQLNSTAFYSFSVIVFVFACVWLNWLVRFWSHVNNKKDGYRFAFCVSFLNQPKAQLGYLRGVTPVCRYLHPFCGWRIWLPQESLRHILASPGYAPGKIAVNVTWMERGFNARQTHRSMYPSIFNRLRTIARYWSEIAAFSYPLAFNAPIGVLPLEFRGKVWSS